MTYGQNIKIDSSELILKKKTKRPQDTDNHLLGSKKKRWGLRWEKEEAGLHECRVTDMKSE